MVLDWKIGSSTFAHRLPQHWLLRLCTHDPSHSPTHPRHGLRCTVSFTCQPEHSHSHSLSTTNERCTQ
ncbi:uncharacterized protein SCHCODRAFT_01332340 [Schizophyllum commune H4-8]|uniref:uncharacterized protein n=1 Tax=Schizophyllum commune (strain H4-8 / FGSC 9210) TaxID=578458 RepID=UPI00216066B7|nr:uncharacterized protein SCHCODRAFT_01332340 [Schizophyllum commune H4-8]KAI5888563.1 hypothetical protein SCHCODRAFT_01332340 [Schizophyllum commune H4-8]